MMRFFTVLGYTGGAGENTDEQNILDPIAGEMKRLYMPMD